MLKLKFTSLLLFIATQTFAWPSGFTYKPYETNGGTVRLPHTIQPDDALNTYVEAFELGGFTFYENSGWQLNLYGKQTYTEDTYQNAWNNKLNMELGIQVKKQIDDNLSIYLNHSYNVQDQRIGLRLKYQKTELGYNYYRDWWIGEKSSISWLQVNKTALKFWGVLQSPSTPYPGDENMTVTNFGQVSWHYGMFDTKYELTPFASYKLTVDRKGFDYNNSFQPSFGIMLINPTKFGEMFVKFGYTAEYRWQSENLSQGPMFEIGWYRAD